MKSLKDHDPNKGKKTWERQEKRLAKKTGGRRTRGSGCGHDKGDVDCGHDSILIEAKATDKKSISLKRDWLAKITNEACAVGKVPGVAITFKDMPVGTDEDWLLLPVEFLKRCGVLPND